MTSIPAEPQTDKLEALEAWSENDARTWSEREQKVYETGHREGESCQQASWVFALDDAFEIDAADTVDEYIALITAKLKAVEITGRIEELKGLVTYKKGDVVSKEIVMATTLERITDRLATLNKIGDKNNV